MFASLGLRRALLLVAFTVAMGLHLRWSWTTIRFLSDPTKVPDMRMIQAVNSRGQLREVPENLQKQGVLVRDRIVEVADTPVTTRGEIFRALRRQPPVTDIPIVFEHQAGGGRVTAKANTGRYDPEPYRLSTILYGFAVNIFTPGFCIALAFFIAWQRPDNHLSWLLLLTLYGLSQIARFNGILRLEYPFWYSVQSNFLMPFGTLIWPAAWLWFCLDFPAARRGPLWLTIFKWALGALALFFAVLVGIDSMLGIEFGRDLGLGWFFQVLGTVQGPYLWGCAFAGLAALFYKLRIEENPDTRRRLRVLCAGLAIGILPLIVSLIYGFDRIPETAQATVVFLLVFIPISVGYVLIVQRAMDLGVVVRQGLQYALASRATAVLQAVLMVVLILVVFAVGADQMTSRPLRLAVIALAFASIFFVQKLVELAQRWIDRRFFREAVNAEHLLTELGEKVRTIVEPEPLIATVKERISEALHVPRVEFVTDLGPAMQNGAIRVYWDDPGGWARRLSAADQERLRALDAELLLPVRTQGEALGVISLGPKRSEEPYSPTDVKLLESVATQTAFALENSRLSATVAQQAAQRERIHREIEIAREVQERLLPKQAPEIPGLDLAGVCVPAQTIGGDYYDYLTTPAGEYGFAIGDIAGKGIPASLLMASLQSSLRGLIAGGALDLPELMKRLNRLVYDATPTNRFATFFYALYDSNSRRMRCICAGHNPALLIRAGGSGIHWIKPNGLALGLTRQATYDEYTLILAPGDVLILYTDGVTEAMNESSEEYGETRLAIVARDHAELPAAQILEAILGSVRAFVGAAPPHDDLTLLILRAP